LLVVGLDLGTQTTCMKVAIPGTSDLLFNEILPTLVGYAKEGIVENLLPGNAKLLFGHLAVRNRLYLRIVHPLAGGVVDDPAAARDFIRHLRQSIPTTGSPELRVLAGIPAAADRGAREKLLRAFEGFFSKALLVPEPFLAALGFRDETRLNDPAYIDPVRNSIFVDIGAGTTDTCLVQGYFPTAEDQISVAFAGDRVDAVLQESIRRAHPDVVLSIPKVREIKEAFSFVGKPDQPVYVNVTVGGKPRKLELSEAIGDACQRMRQDSHRPGLVRHRLRVVAEHRPDRRGQSHPQFRHRAAAPAAR
jgi:rod shape-determining protein MreB